MYKKLCTISYVLYCSFIAPPCCGALKKAVVVPLRRTKKAAEVPLRRFFQKPCFYRPGPLFHSIPAGQRHNQRTCKNTEIRNIKYHSSQRRPFYAQAEIIHHIFPLKPVIGIAERPAQQKRQPRLQPCISLRRKGCLLYTSDAADE